MPPRLLRPCPALTARERVQDAAAADAFVRGVGALGAADVVREMRAHAGSAQAQRAGCARLMTLSHNNGQQPGSAAVAKAGGIKAVVVAVREHRADRGVAEAGRWAVKNLAAANDANKAAIAEAGGIEAIVAALEQHPADAAVQEQGCWALMGIGWSQRALQKRIAQAGAAAAVERAVAAPGATANTKKSGQQLLDKLRAL